MKAILALATLALEEKGRQVAGEAKSAYGDAVVQARDATQSVRRSVGQQPLVSLVIAGVVGYALSLVVQHRQSRRREQSAAARYRYAAD